MTSLLTKPHQHAVKPIDFSLTNFWFIVRPAPIAQGQQMLIKGLRRLGIESFYPMVTRSQRCGRAGMTVKREPYLRGYIPIKLKDHQQKDEVDRLPGFLSFMRPPGSIERFYMLTPIGMDLLGRMADQTVAKSERKTPFEVGEMVKAVEGPFSSFGGKVVDTDEKQQRVTVEMQIFAGLTPVEFEAWQLEKEDDGLPHAERIR
jgi:transcription antitermination factor NusG